MIELLNKEFEIFCNDNVISGIEENYSKIIGVKTYHEFLNENEKFAGYIILILNSGKKKFCLNQLVQFSPERIKWRCSDIVNGFAFYLVDPYWVQKYKVNPKIEVPIKVFEEDKVITIMRELNYEQFKQSRLLEFYVRNKVPYAIVEAYKNFYKLKSPGKYYKAINSTVRNYFVTESQLKKVISQINHECNRIKIEWKKYIEKAIEDRNIPKVMQQLIESEKAEVISINDKK